MTVVMGPDAVNDDKFTTWRHRLTVLGLIFDTVAGTVAMPESKILKAKHLVAKAFHAASLSRTEYRSLLGSLRHVATCVRPTRVFLQRLPSGERIIHRARSIALSAAMRDDLLWWWHVLGSPSLNDVPPAYFDASSAHNITVFTDASDIGICAIIPSLCLHLTYKFSPSEQCLVREFHLGSTTSSTPTTASC
ncbi:hypothetical protein PC120_g21266 [Phytophthora cactorum]|nr:hypothetical protein PC120_g21266 [Phytophthora cactorum]